MTMCNGSCLTNNISDRTYLLNLCCMNSWNVYTSERQTAKIHIYRKLSKRSQTHKSVPPLAILRVRTYENKSIFFPLLLFEYIPDF